MKKLTLFILIVLTAAACQQEKVEVGTIYHDGWIDFNKNGKKDIFEDSKQPIDKRVKDLLSQMTIEEKSCQLATLYGFGRVLNDSLPTEKWKEEVWKDGIGNIDEMLNGVGRAYRTNYNLIYPFSNHAEAINTVQKWFIEETRLGIPVDFSNEGIHGLNHTLATPLPAPIGIGSTWNKALVRKAGEIAGKEAKVLGYTNVYAPILDVPRDPRWGRIVECYGEDPFLIGELGKEMVWGIQSEGVASTLKHFAVYSIPKGGRDGACRTDPHVSPRELHEIHLYPFKEVIQKASPMGVMSSYNDWDGVPVTASSYFLTDLLRKEYGFDGYVVSDSEAVEFVHTKHRVAETYEDAVKQVLAAGMNVRTHFTPPADFIMPIREAVKKDPAFIKIVDQRVAEVLRTKFRMGLFDSPFVENPELANEVAGADKHLDFVHEMQAQSLVLLKNEGDLLPLDKNKLNRVLVTGPLADLDNFMISRYGPNGLDKVTVLEGVKQYLKNDVEVLYSQGCKVADENWPATELIPEPMTQKEKQGIDDAVAKAKRSDVIIAVLGEDVYTVGESRSRTSLDLPGRQQQLLEALYATGKPVVLVLINGQPLTINWADRYVPAILEAWFPSYRGGVVIAETLFGEYNPGGKLTVTFPKTVGQIELNFPFKPGSHGIQYAFGPNGSGNTRNTGALYPFGYGLSYTEFEYSGLVVEPAGKERFNISCEVTNTGKRKGDEIVQLYVRDKYSSVIVYDYVLRGFERITLEPGETKKVEFTVEPEHLQLLNKDMEWVVEPGEFEIMVGASSEDIRLTETVNVI